MHGLTEQGFAAALLPCPLSETEAALSCHHAECDKCAASWRNVTLLDFSWGSAAPGCEGAQSTELW